MDGEQLVFNTGDRRQCHTVNIVNDDDCEQPAENFFSDLSYVSGELPVTINPDRTTVFIDDDNEAECGKITECGNVSYIHNEADCGKITECGNVSYIHNEADCGKITECGNVSYIHNEADCGKITECGNVSYIHNEADCGKITECGNVSYIHNEADCGKITECGNVSYISYFIFHIWLRVVLI